MCPQDVRPGDKLTIICGMFNGGSESTLVKDTSVETNDFSYDGMGGDKVTYNPFNGGTIKCYIQMY